ncbi:response regulator transcription factor [Nocardioidaceae bacterium SCSIO 66511]|nr:response regulator transcription factor [Nocardioidaceae bacterium SCSIO 66511]
MGLRVVLCEDSLLLREGVVGVLNRFGHEVVADLGDACDLEAAVADEQPDLVITDVRMPPTFSDEGLVAAIALRRRWTRLAVMVLSQYVQPTYATELLDIPSEAGVGYLLKERIGDVTEFASAVASVAAGGTVLDPDVVRLMVSNKRDPLRRLSPREREVLSLMAEGRSNAEIATTLVVSDAAVAKHVGGIMTKLDLPPDAAGHRRVLAVLAYLRE